VIDRMNSLGDLFSERNVEMSWLGILIMFIGIFVVPAFLESGYAVIATFLVGMIVWIPAMISKSTE